MATSNNNSTTEHSIARKKNNNGLPVSIHPDDAKDKVFTAILKALLKMGNKPSSPKELANIIVKHKYATLGGATPFATVSSRISQHFKRAAEHNPPRAPLLAKHVDQNHSRKINYSLATEGEKGSSSDNLTAASATEITTNTANDKTRKIPMQEEDSDSSDEENEFHKAKKHKPNSFIIEDDDNNNKQSSYILEKEAEEEEEENSEGELPDYHEEMLQTQDDETMLKKRRQSSIVKAKLMAAAVENNNQQQPRKASFSFSSGYSENVELWTPFSFEQDFDNVFQHNNQEQHISFNIETPESISISELDDYFSSNTTTSSSSSAAGPTTNQTKRKSFSSGMLGPNDKSLLQKVLLASAARGVSLTDKMVIKEEIAEEDEDEVKQEETVELKKEEVKTLVKEKQQVAKESIVVESMNGEDFVKFEDDEKKETVVATAPVPVIATPSTPVTTTNITPVPTPINNTTVTASTTATITKNNTNSNLSTAEILKSMNIQNLNLSALHQIPNLQQHLPPTFDLAKTMATYMQSLAKSANHASTSTNTNQNTTGLAMDLKSILQKFPILEAFIKKDSNNSTPTPALTTATAATSTASNSSTKNDSGIPNLISTASSNETIINTLQPMTPVMYVTLIDHIAVCVVVLPKTEITPEYRIMRRVDTGFINGTILLTAGGIETESERSMILSFEMERVRMPKKKSQLFGTWIPLRRAQELAVTCSIQHKLKYFLEDNCIETYFPSPLPIQFKKRDNARLTALALAAIRTTNSEKSNSFLVPPISRQSSSSGSMGATQLQELLLTHPNKALKSNGKQILAHKEEEAQQQNIPTVSIATINNQSHPHHHDSQQSDGTQLSSSSSSSSSSSEEEEEEEEQPLHIHPRDLQKKKRKATTAPIVKNEHVQKKKNLGGGKWANKPNTTILIKKPANKKAEQQKKAAVVEEEIVDNVVVEHKSTVVAQNKLVKENKEKQEVQEKEEEEDDEDIDIGGSDFDDDLR